MTLNHIKILSEENCPLCESKNMILFFEMLNVPVHCNLIWKNRKEAQKCTRGDIKLVFCPNCSYITNMAFEQEKTKYSQAYDNSLNFSPFFKNYAKSLAIKLIEKYNLYNKNIIEIGCGKGYFLSLLCKLGNNHGVGFDPSFVESDNNHMKKNIKYIKDYYSEKYSDYQADLIVSRHVFEHI